MSKTKIDWADYSINPVRGRCPNEACPLGERCYARSYYTRFHWDPTLRYEQKVWDELKKIKEPSRIFVGSTIELFHKSINPYWLKDILEWAKFTPQHTFIFLTKCPENLHRWKFPDNCQVGVSATDGDMFWRALYYLRMITAKVKFISVEPFLNWPDSKTHFARIACNKYTSEHNLASFGITWLIIGQLRQASKKSRPDAAWIREIMNAADKAKIPVFLKNNLQWLPEEKPFYTRDPKVCEECEAGDPCHACGAGIHLRQEFPK